MTRSEQDLAAGASQVGYELVQLAAMPAALRRAESVGDDYAANACLESMLLHARNLIDFLIEGGPDSDIRRSDFTATKWSPPNKPPKVRLAKKRLRDALPMLNRDLSHITWARIEKRAPFHDPERIAHDVVEVMGTFVDRLKSEGNIAADWFVGDLHQARLLLEKSPVTGMTLYTTSGASGRVAVTELPGSPSVDSRVTIRLFPSIFRDRRG